MQVLPGDMLAVAAAPPPIPASAHELIVMSWEADNRTTWDRNDPVQVEAARARFAELRGGGYMAYKLNASAGGEVLQAFDPDAQTIVFRPQMVGG
jgi:hypothetical protein